MKFNTGFNSLAGLLKRFPDEQSCRDFVEQLRWNGKPTCPHCSHDKVYKFKNGKLFKCAKCSKQFTVKVGTIFEDSALPLQKWFIGMYLLTAHKKGISSLQLSRDLDITQKSAWFMLHRLRYAIRTETFAKPLTNVVEADETFIGGKEKNKHANKRTGNTVGRSLQSKTAVVGIVERKGKLFSIPVTSPSIHNLDNIINSNVKKKSTVITDEYVGYRNVKKNYKHEIIKHKKGEYVKGTLHLNTIEGFWSLLKRGIVGIYHQVSPKHLHRYCSEFNYRYNTKGINDTDRFAFTFSKLNGRLTYQALIND